MARLRFLLPALIVGLLLVAGSASAGLAPPVGSLTQPPSPDGCVSEAGTGGLCTAGFALDGPDGIAVSPDGDNAYAGSALSDAAVAFARDADGTLTQIGCVSETGTGGLCADGFALEGAGAAAVSPDGQNLYLVSLFSDAVVAFARNPDGTLTELGCVSEDGTGGLCTDGFALNEPTGIAVSPDGANVYVASVTSDAVVAFSRNPDGTLTQIGCVSETGTGGLCTDGFALDGALGVGASPDGGNVYVASVTSDAVVAFDRNPDGTLTQIGCVSEDGTGGLCTDGFALDLPAGVAASADGRNVYVASVTSDAVVAFTRSSSGTLTLLGCISEDTTGGLCADGYALDFAVDGGIALAVSPDGRNVYAASTGSDAVAVLDRATADSAGAPPSCDPLIEYCGLPGSIEPGPPLLAPSGGGDGGPAVGVNRMPDLSIASLRAWWDGSRLHVVLRIRVVKPRLARPFDLELRGDDFTRTIRVRPRSRTHVTVDLWVPLGDSPAGARVVARLDPGRDVLEGNERNNRASASVRSA